LDVIKLADWIIDMGPDGGDGGGNIVAEGRPEAIAANPKSHTGQCLATRLLRTDCRARLASVAPPGEFRVPSPGAQR
jgi:excinuclease ABC subunit A